MKQVPRLLLLVLLGAVTTACGARPFEPPRTARAGTTAKTEKRAKRAAAKPAKDGNNVGAAISFEELQSSTEWASVRQRILGQASYYADSLAGNKMASGERYEPAMPVAAHRTLPFGTVVRVVRISDGRSVVLRIADRGPFGHQRRIIDVSRVAAERLGMLRDGVVEVRVEVLTVTRRAPE